MSRRCAFWKRPERSRKRNAANEATLAAEGGAGRPTKQAPPLLMRLLLALEEAVSDDTRKLYERGFAWFRLFLFWAGLRLDNNQGLNPSSLEVRARSVAGTLERTKTSGPGKNATTLPVFVSNKAFLVQPWLLEGLAR